MAGHHHLDGLLQQTIKRGHPVPTVRLAYIGDAVAKHHVADKEHTTLGQENGRVLWRVRWPHMLQDKIHAPNLERACIGIYPGIGIDQAGLRIDPRCQLRARRIQPQARGVGVDVFLSQSIGDDLGTEILEHLQTIDMIGMVMRQYHGADGLWRDGFDLLHQLLRQCRRAQRINHHHAVTRHHKPSVGDEVGVFG